MIRRTLTGLLALGGALTLTSPVFSQETYPTRPITLVVPYPVGGSNDILARLVARPLADIVSRLNTKVNRILSSPELKAAFLREEAVAHPISAAQFAATIAQDIPRWQAIAHQQSIVAE